MCYNSNVCVSTARVAFDIVLLSYRPSSSDAKQASGYLGKQAVGL